MVSFIRLGFRSELCLAAATVAVIVGPPPRMAERRRWWHERNADAHPHNLVPMVALLIGWCIRRRRPRSLIARLGYRRIAALVILIGPRPLVAALPSLVRGYRGRRWRVPTLHRLLDAGRGDLRERLGGFRGQERGGRRRRWVGRR